MKKILTAMTLTVLMTASIAIPAFAQSSNQTTEVQAQNQTRIESHFRNFNPTRKKPQTQKLDMTALAKKLNVNTQGMTQVQIRDAIKQALQAKQGATLQQEAQKLSINTQGLTTKQIQERLREARLTTIAKKLNINTSGMTQAQIQDSIKQAFQAKQEANLQQEAQKLGINTQGLTLKQLQQQIHAKLKLTRPSKQNHPSMSQQSSHPIIPTQL